MGIVHNEAANVCLAGRLLFDEKSWYTEVCAAHRLQTAIKHAVNQPQITKLLASARRIVLQFKHSALAMEALLKKQQVPSDKPKLPKRLVQDCATRWNSTYYMLERLVSLRWEVGAVLSESGGDSSLDLSPDQWKLAEMLIPVLRDLEETTRELSGERYATLSMVLPLMHFLHSELAPRTGEKPAVRSLKTELQKQLRTRFELEEHDMSSLRVLAATLDPRFRHILLER